MFCFVLDSPHVTRGRSRVPLHHAVDLHLNVHLVVVVVFEQVKNQLPTTRAGRDYKYTTTQQKQRENNKTARFSIHETIRGIAASCTGQ